MGKDKRRLDADLKDSKDKVASLEEEVAATKDTISKRDKSIKELEEVRENSEGLIKQLQKKIAELLARIEELEEELENERKAKQKTELARKELEANLEEMNEQLLVQGDATTAQSEIAKKKDSEIARLRKEIDEATAAGEDAVSALKGKMAAAVKKAKAKSDKDKAAVAAELADATADISTLKKQKQSADKAYRVLEDQLLDLKGRYEEQEIALVDVEAKAAKAASDGSNTGKALEEAEHKIGLLTKDKKSLEQALDEVRGEAEAESKAKHDTNLKLKAAQSEIEALNEQLEEEASTKAAMQQKLSKALADAASGKGGFGIEDSERVEELEDAKKKLNARVKEMEEALMAAET